MISKTGLLSRSGVILHVLSDAVTIDNQISFLLLFLTLSATIPFFKVSVTVVLAWAMGFKVVCKLMYPIAELLRLLHRSEFFQKLFAFIGMFRYEFPSWVNNWSVDDVPK